MKSRHISVIVLYSRLQLEYLSYFLKYKITIAPYNDKFKLPCIGKRKTIERIASKNNLPSIFTSKTTLDTNVNALLNEWGIPNFEYKDNDMKEKFYKWDVFSYFRKGVGVKYLDNGVKFGEIVYNNYNKEECEIKSLSNDKIIVLPYTRISRIFADNFWDELL